MAKKNKELVLESRYIHTGNSGVTISIERDVKRPTRGILRIHNGSMGAFTTDMEIRGNDYNGFTANQLRDLALVFLESADGLDRIGKGEDFHYQGNENSNIITDRDTHYGRLSDNLKDHLQNKLVLTGMEKTLAWDEVEKMTTPESYYGDTEVACDDNDTARVVSIDVSGTKLDLEKFKQSWNTELKSKKEREELDVVHLIKDRLKTLTAKL